MTHLPPARRAQWWNTMIAAPLLATLALLGAGGSAPAADNGASGSDGAGGATVAWEPRNGGSGVTLWNMDGEAVAWESLGNRRWAWMWSNDRGIDRGVPLFRGRREGMEVVGDLFHHAEGCPPRMVAVRGPIARSEERFALLGNVPLLGASCTVTGTEPHTILVELIGEDAYSEDAVNDMSVITALDLPAFGLYTQRFATIGADKVGVRLDPSEEAPVIGTIGGDGTTLWTAGCGPDVPTADWYALDPETRQARIQGAWCDVYGEGVSGWVHGSLLELVEGD